MEKNSLHIVVIDASSTCKLLAEVLTHEGHQVRIFQDSVQALRSLVVKCEGPVPDLVVVDLLLPRITGYEVIKRLRSHAGGESLPIIATSLLRGVLFHLYARLAGADVFVEKPLKTQEFLTLVQRSATGRPGLTDPW